MSGIAGFIISGTRDEEYPGHRAEKITALKEGAVLNITVIEDMLQKEAEEYIGEVNYNLLTLYSRYLTLYPGIMAKVGDKLSELSPVIKKTAINGIPAKLYILYADERFSYGVYNLETARYRSVRTLIYADERNMLFDISLFFPKEEFDQDKSLKMISSFRWD